MGGIRALSIIMGALSGIVGIAFSIMAFILVAAGAGDHLVLLHWAGAFLFAIVAAHLLPLAVIKRRFGLVLYVTGVVATAAVFGSLYYFATIADPFRSEGELFMDVPFWLAAFLCIFPLARASLRFILLAAPEHPSWKKRLTIRWSEPLTGAKTHFR